MLTTSTTLTALTFDCDHFRYIRSAEYDQPTNSLTITIVGSPDDIQRSSSRGVDNVDDELLDVANLVPTAMREPKIATSPTISPTASPTATALDATSLHTHSAGGFDGLDEPYEVTCRNLNCPEYRKAMR